MVSPPSVPAPKWWLPQGAVAHLLCQSGCQQLNCLRLGPGLDQHGVGFSCNEPQQDMHQNHDKAPRSKSGQFQGANQDSFTHAKPPLPQQEHSNTPAAHLLLPQAAGQQRELELSPRDPAGKDQRG